MTKRNLVLDNVFIARFRLVKSGRACVAGRVDWLGSEEFGRMTLLMDCVTEVPVPAAIDADESNSSGCEIDI